MSNIVNILIYLTLIHKHSCDSCNCESNEKTLPYDKDSIDKSKLNPAIPHISVSDIVRGKLPITTKSNYEEAERDKEGNSLEYDEEDLYETTCPFFKKVANIGFDKMADVWQTVFYRTNEVVACFKIYIRRMTSEELNYIKLTYGDFNRTIDWNNSIFQIHSNDKHLLMKHYLFGNGNDFGVFNNIVILEENDGNDTKYYIQEESPDQWMVDKHLLLMRDCDTGDVVVFSRVPHSPKLGDIHEALKAFGEEDLHGSFACVNERLDNPQITNYIPENHFYVRSIKKVLRDVYNKIVAMTVK